MLPWYMESTLFQHTTDLSLFHNVHQILHHIFSEMSGSMYVAAVSPLPKITFSEEFIETLQSNL